MCDAKKEKATVTQAEGEHSMGPMAMNARRRRKKGGKSAENEGERSPIRRRLCWVLPMERNSINVLQKKGRGKRGMERGLGESITVRAWMEGRTLLLIGGGGSGKNS